MLNQRKTANRKIKKTVLICLSSVLFSFTVPQLALAEEFGPLDYSVPWDWPNPAEVANALFAARMMEEKKNGLLGPFDAVNAAIADGGGGNGGFCSPGSTQHVFNCVITVNNPMLFSETFGSYANRVGNYESTTLYFSRWSVIILPPRLSSF